MIRQFAVGLALFLTPFAVYALFLWAVQTKAVKTSGWSPPAFRWLTIVALFLVIAGFAIWALYSGAPPGSTYVPAHMENGRFVPGVLK
jgi:ABC-type nickel/cobalt efflux system permease component RcnA